MRDQNSILELDMAKYEQKQYVDVLEKPVGFRRMTTLQRFNIVGDRYA